ncbi:negative elongation factor E isoform X2 [Lissotriton helveticus]
MATEQAKMLVKSGAISAIKAENKNSGFKRSRTLEGKLKDPEKGPVPTFQPFQRSMSTEEETSESSRRLQRKSLYESFVSSSDQIREADKEAEESLDAEKDPERDSARHPDRDSFDRSRERDRDRDRERDRERGDRGDRADRGDRERDRSDRDRERDRGDRERDRDFRRSDSFPDRRAPRKGNTVYVNGAGMTKTMLRGAFANYGNIIDLATDSVRNCAFVTFEKMESADQAIAELNGTKVEDVLIRVSIARKQPMLEAATGNSVWGSLSVQNSSKGSHRDKRSQVVYNEDIF